VHGWALVQRIELSFDKEKMATQLPGSWIPFFLSLTIFCIRYFLGETHAMESPWISHPLVTALDGLATTFSGIFIGRLLGYWHKYRTTPHENLAI